MMSVPFSCRYPNPSSFSYERRFFCPFEYALQPPAWYTPEHIALEKPELPLGVSEIRKYSGPQCFMIPGNHGTLHITHCDLALYFVFYDIYVPFFLPCLSLLQYLFTNDDLAWNTGLPYSFP
jgi:hypothetical protein